MTPFYKTDRLSLYEGDCRSVLPYLSDCSVDSVVCDPPYELGFMGKGWDRSGIAYDLNVWLECLRVLKPGGHLLAFGGSRTYHRLACAIEDAGFEIRDQIQWLYGSGFPKSLDVSKAIDGRGEGSEIDRERINRIIIGKGFKPRPTFHTGNIGCTSTANEYDITVSASDEGKQWQGWGTALKPAHEILTLAYKPHEYDTERDKIYANLSLLEARLWLLLPASIAEKHFQLSPQGYVEACGSVQMDAAEWQSTQDGLLGQMDTSRCVSVMSTCLNTVRSWRSILDVLCEITSTSTIETKTSLITDLRILNYSLSQTTPSIIIKAASQADGQALNALPVAQHFAAARLKLNGILTLSALDAATSKAHTLHRAGVETNSIVLARKPLIRTVAENVLQHGTGGLNIDGCRIDGDVPSVPQPALRPNGFDSGHALGSGVGRNGEMSQAVGRWPANVIHDGSEEVLAGFPETTSNGQVNPYDAKKEFSNIYGKYPNEIRAPRPTNSGSAARFFYCAKADQADRNEGLEQSPQSRAMFAEGTGLRNNGDGTPRNQASTSRNPHPTVKPTDLMRYLCRLVTPPGGVVLDPFCGSGSTGKAAMLEGLRFIGIELSEDYCELAQRRIEAVTKQGLLFTTA